MNDENCPPPYEVCLLWSASQRCNMDCLYCFRRQHREQDHGRIRRELGRAKRTPSLLFQLKYYWNLAAICKAVLQRKKKLPSEAINIPALLKTLEDTGKIFHIIWTGLGEPFLVPNLVEASAALTKKHYISCATNLVLPQCKDFANAIDPAHTRFIHASLHIEELLKKKLLDRYVEHFYLFKKKGFYIYAFEVGHPALLKDLTRYRKMMKKEGIEIIFGHFTGFHQGKWYPDAYTEEESDAFGFEKLEMYLDHYHSGVLCNAGYNIYVVNEGGQVHSCYKIPEDHGHIYKKIILGDALHECSPDFCLNPVRFRDEPLFEIARKVCKKINKYQTEKPVK